MSAKSMFLRLFPLLFIIIVSSCSPSTETVIPLQTTTHIQSQLSPTPTIIDISALPSPTGAPYGIELLQGYAIQQIYKPLLVMPTDVRVSPDGRIFFTEWEGHNVLELMDDGSVTTVLEMEKPVNSILIDSQGFFYLMQEDRLMKISPSGERTTLLQINAPGGWAMDAQDNLFMITNGELVRISSGGEMTLIATSVENGGMVVTQSGEIFFSSGTSGQIFKVTQDGAISVLASGFPYDAFNLALDPQGNLFQNVRYFTQVSLDDGSFFEPVLRQYNALMMSRPFAFLPTGEVIFIGPTTNNAFKASIENETMSVLVAGIGNSHAMAVDESGIVVMGASNEFPLVPGRVIKILSDGTVEDFATGFFTIRDLTFDEQGNLYVSDLDQEGQGGGRLVRIEKSGSSRILVNGHYDFSSIVYDPNSQEILAYEQFNDQLVRITQEGVITPTIIDVGGEAVTIDLARNPMGDFIALVVYRENYNTGPVHRSLFRITSDNQVSLITDIDTPMATSEDDVAVSPDGDIFVVGPEEHPDFRLLKISPTGEITIVARNLPYDTLSIDIGNTGDIFFTCSAGVFKIWGE